MGVLGIVPFLLKKCPQVIESIPNRFHALEGKTIAIDATLVTQRLHFTPDPRPYRHVLGWYQLIAELRQHNIKVVCVFDGKHRIPAKSNEVERRRQVRLQAQVRGAWEKSRHERLLSLTEALQSVETLSEDQQQEVLNSLRNQADQPLSSGSKEEQVDTTLVLDPSAEDAQQGSMVTSTYILPNLESLLPVEDSSVPHSTVVTSSSATDETSVRQNLTEGSFVISPSSAGGEKPVSVQDSPPSDNATAMNIPTLDQNKPFPENVAPCTDKQAASSNGMLLTKDGMIPLEPLTTPEVSTKPTTLQDISVAAQLHHPTQTEDFGIPDTDRTAANKASSGANRSVNDNQYLSKVIRHLHEHYTRTSTTGIDGFILASTDEPDALNLPSIPISRVQLKYTQEESQLWEQIVPKSADAEVNIPRVVEQVKQLALVVLPQDEPELAGKEIEQATEQQEDETAPISEWAATLEERSGHMVASLMRRANPPTTATYTESRLILEAMGIPCIESPMHYEAEALASSLVISGLADLVGSEDSDVLMYNAPLLRHMTNKKVPLQIIPPSTETSLDLSRSAFVDAAILMGTDFVRRVKQIGPNTAYRLMHKHGSIERMLEEEPKFRPPDVADYLEQVRVARLIFSSLPPPPSPESIAQGEWNERAIKETMAHFGLEKYMEEELIPGALSDNYFNEEPKEFS